MKDHMYRMAQAILAAETTAEYFRCRGWEDAAQRWEKIAKDRQRDAAFFASRQLKYWGRFPVQVQWSNALLGYCYP